MSDEKIVITKIKDNEALDIDSDMTDQEKEELFKKVRTKMQLESSQSEETKSREVILKPSSSKFVKKLHWKHVIAACLCLALLIPASVFAANRIKAYLVSLKQDKLHSVYQIDKDNTMQPSNDVKNIKLIYDFSDSYETTVDGAYYSFDYKDGFNAGKDFLVELLQIDTSTLDEFYTEDVKESSTIEIGGKKAIYMKLYDTNNSQYKKDTDYNQRLVLFFDDYGYAIQIYGMQGIGKKEFINLAAGIDMVVCSKEEAADYMTLSDYIGRRFNNSGNDTQDGRIKDGKDAVYSIGQEFEFMGMNYMVQSVAIRDSIDGLNYEFFNDSCGLTNVLPKYASKEGILLSYNRELLSFGNGYDTPEKSVVDTKEVALKFVYVTMKVKNNTDRDQDIMACKRMTYIEEKQEDYYYDLSQYERGEVSTFQLDSLPQYFEETLGGKGYYIRTIKAGETLLLHTGYFVDEDKLDEMMIQFDYGSSYGDIKYIDIRQEN